MKKVFIVAPIAALTIAAGGIFAGTTLFPQAEDRVEQQVDTIERSVEQKVSNTLATVGIDPTRFSDDDDVDHAPIETSVGFVDIDDDFREIPTNILTAEQAVDIAKKHAAGSVTDIDLDNDNNKAIYTIEFADGQTEYEVDIDAVTGDVVDVEKDLD